MPMSSMEIAQMNGAYQGAAMNQQHYAGMIGQQQWQPSQASPSQVDYGSKAAGKVAGFASSVAAPAMMLGAGLMGADPFSMAFRGGRMGMAMGGTAGMLGMGALGAGVALGGAAVAGYAVNQGFQAIQQQQQLQQQLGETYRFRNQFGGQGFTAGGMQNIGTMMRGMSTQQGAMGEMTSFEELGRLAQNMGRMGMDQGVRNAKDFSDKFRTMVKTLKEVATHMGTSLEDAQKMMAGMRASGAFKTADQLQAFKMIKAGTETGVLSSSEMASAQVIGSQISRSIGGKGKAGGIGAMRTLNNIGTQVQMGLLNEEQIYDATGLHGAEGRQALMTQQMSSSARFLGTTKGRYLLASVAGKDGTLDQDDVMAFMHGSVSVEETRKRAYENLHGVGRANFIRNTGRLKGEVLSAFGGNTNALALMGWMNERGINVNTNSDRAMLYLQRTLKLGRDEADVVVEQVRNMPQIMRQQLANEEEGKFGGKLRHAEAHRGLEALKHKFSKAKADMSASIGQVFTDIVAGAGRSADAWLGELYGVKASFYQANVLASGDLSARGGATGRAEGFDKFGFGRKGAGTSGFSSFLQQHSATMTGGGRMGLVSRDAQGGLGGDARNVGLLTSKHTTVDRGLEFMGAGLSGQDTSGGSLTAAGRGANLRNIETKEARDRERMVAGAGEVFAGLGGGPNILTDSLGLAMSVAGGVGLLPTTSNRKKTKKEKWIGEQAGTDGFVRGNLNRAAGTFFNSEAGERLSRGVLGTAEQRGGARKEISRRMSGFADATKDGAGLDVYQRGEKNVLEAAGAAMDVQELTKGKTEEEVALMKDQLSDIAARWGFADTEEMMSGATTFITGSDERRDSALRQLAEQAGTRAKERIEGLGATGPADKENQTKLSQGVGGAYVTKRMEAEQLRVEAKKAKPGEQRKLLEQANEAEREAYKHLHGMSGKARQQFLNEAGGMGGAGFLTEAVYEVESLSGMLSARGSGKNTRDKRIAESLGIKLDKKELKQMHGMSPEEAAKFLQGKSGGLIGADAKGDLAEAIGASRSTSNEGGQGVAAGKLSEVLSGVSKERLDRAKKEKDPSYEVNQEILTTLKNAFGTTGSASRSLSIIANNTSHLGGTMDTEAVNPVPPQK